MITYVDSECNSKFRIMSRYVTTQIFESKIIKGHFVNFNSTYGITSNLRRSLIKDTPHFKKVFSGKNFCKPINFTLRRIYCSFSKVTCFSRRIMFSRLSKSDKQCFECKMPPNFQYEKMFKKSAPLIRSNAVFIQKNQPPGDMHIKHKRRHDSIEECINHYIHLWEHRVSYKLWGFDMEP